MAIYFDFFELFVIGKFQPFFFRHHLGWWKRFCAANDSRCEQNTNTNKKFINQKVRIFSLSSLFNYFASYHFHSKTKMKRISCSFLLSRHHKFHVHYSISCKSVDGNNKRKKGNILLNCNFLIFAVNAMSNWNLF